MGMFSWCFDLICHNFFFFFFLRCFYQLASVAQLDACQTGDQEVAGSTLTGSATFFYRDLIMQYFLQSFSPFC